MQFSQVKVLDLDGDGPNRMDMILTSPNDEHQGQESSLFVLEYSAAVNPPTSMDADAVSCDQIDVSWDHPFYHNGSRLYCWTEDTGYQKIEGDEAMIGSTLEIGTYSHMGLKPNSYYCYKAVAYDELGNPGLGDPDLEGPEDCAWTCCPNGDVNGDGMLTPADALCAFRISINLGTLPSVCDVEDFVCEVIAADVNCNGMVTPQDALDILQRSLNLLPPEGCFAETVSRAQAFGTGKMQ